MSLRPNFLIACSLLMTLGTPCIVRAQAGWKTEVVGKNAVLTPPDLAPGEFYQVTIYPRAPLAGAAVTDFLDGVASRRAAALGRPTGEAKPAQTAGQTGATASRTFETPQGAARGAIFVALAVDGRNVRVIEVVASGNVLSRYQAQASAIIREMGKQDNAAAPALGRGLNPASPPTGPLGMVPGGKVVPGIYAGDSLWGDKVNAHFRLYLYASGEFQMCDGAGRQVDYGAGDFRYDPATGKMTIGNTFSLSNNDADPNDQTCLYGRAADGTPFLYARTDEGFHYMTRVLHYAGPPDRPSPRQAAAARAAAEAEAKRYKYVVAPGKGIQASQVAGVFHRYQFRYGLSALDESYLLLKDGTVHDGLPVPPDEMDAPLSRRREPEKWGKWRRQGAAVLAAWPDNPGRFAPLQGEMSAPAAPGDRLAGRFGAGETSGSMMLGGSYRLWGVTFTPEGRFLKDGSGGASSGSLGATTNGFSVDTVYDDEGSATVISAPAVGGGVTRRKPPGHRGGTYSLSGYVLTLHYDDGRVVRLPFFFESARRDQIYFEGATLGLDDGK